MGPAASELLQRDAEVAMLAAAIDGVARGDGSLVVLDGPPGIGKTALLREARELAQRSGVRTLVATGSELDRAFAYGLVHQLLEAELQAAEPERRARLLTGAAAHAETIFDLARAPQLEAGQAVLHGLYWLCANLADEQPVALLVDDAHWGDLASLRFLEYLGRRLDGVPLLVVVAARASEPGADQDLLDRLAAQAGDQHLTPEPLSDHAAAALLRRWLSRSPAPEFVAATLQATGGNPFLLESTAREAARQALGGTAQEADRLTDLTGSAVVTGLQRRLRPLGPQAKALAEAAAVLGGRRTIDDLAATVGLPLADARAGLDTLSAAAILQPASLEFTHPLVRAAVARGAAPAALAGLHASAAARLREAGARPDELAVHLLEVPPAGSPEVVQTLRRAADLAVAEGAPDAALPLLQRALREPPREPDRASLLLELGQIEQRTGAPGAMEHLGQALAAGLSGDQSAHAHRARALHLMTTDPAAALDELDRAQQRADDPDLGLQLEAGLLDVTAYLASLADRRAELLDAGRHDPRASPAMLAHLAQDSAYRGEPSSATLGYVERALADRRLLEVVGPASPTFHLLVLTLRHTERPELATRLLDDGDRALERLRTFMGALYGDHARAFWHLMFGSVAAAEAFARSALSMADQMDAPLPRQSAQVVLAEILVEQDRFDEAAALAESIPDGPALDETIIGPDVLSVRGLLRAHVGQREAAEQDLRRAIAQLDRRGWQAPLKSRARLRLAGLLADSSPAEAEDHAAHAVRAAREAQTPGALCAGLRAQARVRGGAEGVALLREADEVMATSPMRLEHGWALHDLGRLLRVDGARVEPANRCAEPWRSRRPARRPFWSGRCERNSPPRAPGRGAWR